MTEDLEELRTPPVPLVALVGCPELHGAVSLYLHREQPPLNTLALPDFSRLPIIGGKERKPVDARMPPPLGILKADWLSKHRTRMPAVLVVLLDRDQVYGDPTQWLQVCTHLDYTKAVIRGRNIKLVVAIVQPTSQGDVNEERLSSLRKRAELDAKCCIVFITHEPSELRRSLARLGSILGELVTTFYREEGRRVKLRIEKKAYSSLELSVRYNFKVAFYAEFRRDWVAALKFYETAYSLLQEVVTNTSMELQPVQRVVEMKAVAEQLHFKISNLLLHGGKETEAVSWFREHSSWYKQMMGPFEGAFLHWAWVSKQFQVFGELLQNRLATASQAPTSNAALRGQPALSERELLPAYYYHIAAVYMVRRRRSFQAALVAFEAFEENNAVDVLAGPPEEVGPPAYVGQAPRLLKRENDNHFQSPTEIEYMRHLISIEKRFQHSLAAIALFKKAHDLFQLMEAGRTVYLLLSDMGREYFAAKDYVNSMRILGSVVGMYRQEGWVVLLGSALTYLRECARCLGLVKEFVEFGLQLITLPLSATISHGYVSGSEVGPFGQLEKTQIHQELVEFLRGVREISSQEGEPGMTLSSTQLIDVEVDLVSPLRMVLSVCVAFHSQLVRLGKVTRLTLCFLTHLPLPVTIDEVEILFNQSSCNFSTKSSKQLIKGDQADLDSRAKSGLELQPGVWKRISIDVTPEESGKLECLAVVAHLGPHATIRCQAESVGTREDIPFWKSEPGIDPPPLVDPTLACYGQKVIQVEEPEALVDVSLDAPSPGLVGEAFPVCISIRSTGHSVQAGDLEVYFAPSGKSEATLLSTSPTMESNHTQAELLVRSSPDNEGGVNFVKFTGLVEVPEVSSGESWSTVIYVQWLEAKPVTLMATFVYHSSEEGGSRYQYRLHKSKEFDCVEALDIEHHYVAPFRRDALLLGNLDADSPGGLLPAATLALKESSILVVTLKNKSPLPLRLSRIGVTEEDSSRCLVRMPGCKVSPDRILHEGSSESSYYITEGEAGGVILSPQELCTQLFWVHPLVPSRTLLVGTISVSWQRALLCDSSSTSSEVPAQHQEFSVDPVNSQVQLGKIMVESPPLVVTLECPAHAVLGKPFTMTTKVQNMTNTLQEVAFAVVDTPSFIFSGAHSDTVPILPKGTHFLSYKLVPLSSGMQQLPRIKINSAWYSAAFQPSPFSTQIFVFPSPQFESVPSRLPAMDEAFRSLVIS